jgi:hypothetical protein
MEMVLWSRVKKSKNLKDTSASKSFFFFFFFFYVMQICDIVALLDS